MPALYGLMMLDKIRTLAYQKAILECVKENDVVLDLGAGLGILSLFACQAKAKKVYAIEQVGDIVPYAQDVAAANGFKDKIIFIKGLSFDIELPENVDVIVCETLGAMAIEENIVESLHDARSRFLKKDGIVIPSAIDIYLAPIESNDIFKNTIGSWGKDYYGFDFSMLRDAVVNRRFIQTVKPEYLLAPPKIITSFDETKSTPNFEYNINFVTNRNGTLHGVASWFNAQLSPKTDLTNSPFSQATHWQQAFFPIRNPFLIKKGEEININISSKLTHQRLIWNWGMEIKGEKFNYSTLKTILPKRDITNINFYKYKPKLSEEAAINNAILNLCNGERATEEIAEHIRRLFPKRYKTTFLAAEKVAGLLLSYT